MKGMAMEFCGFFSRPNVLLLNDANLNWFRNRHSERRVTKRRISF